jgi:hypothetical protein
MEQHIYTELEIRKLKGQALKDVWHEMIGKPAGLRNVTGLNSIEEIVQAILQGQKDPDYLLRFSRRQHKQKEEESVVEMPPKEKKKPGPKPKPKVNPNPIIVPLVPQTPLRIQAVESMQAPQKKIEVERVVLRKLYIGSEIYFLDKVSNTVYTAETNHPGSICGKWNPITRTLEE